MKIKITLSFMLICLLLCGCAKTEPTEPSISSESGAAPAAETKTAKTYVLPTSYWSYSGCTLEEALETLEELGPDYCTSAKIVEDGIKMELTDKQRDNLIKRNYDYNQGFIDRFLELNSDYRYVPDENLQHLDFYFDEKLPPDLHLGTVYCISAAYGMEYLLMHPDEKDWHVDICIYNCHTNNQVASFTVPYDSVSYGPEEWKKSYEE